MKKIYVGIDIGGTWLKGVAVKVSNEIRFNEIPSIVLRQPSHKVKSRLGTEATVEDFLEALTEIMNLLLSIGDVVGGIGISTAGVVDYAGKEVTVAAKHLQVLTDNRWISYLQNRHDAPVTIINDADATAIGASALGYLNGFNTIGVMPIGTGIGFTVWRNGRKWTPNYSLPLLGSIYTPSGYYDELASVTRLAQCDTKNELCNIFTNELNQSHKEMYIRNLAGIIRTAYLLYLTNKILIGGGLADALTRINYPLEKELKSLLEKDTLLSSNKIDIELMSEGNALSLIGVTLIAVGEEKGYAAFDKSDYTNLTTETPYDSSIHLESMKLNDLVYLLWKTEQEAGLNLEKSLDSIINVVLEIAERLQHGGRLIYVGAGTSGRLAAIDAVEIACTFGFPKHRVISFIAGGIADASIDMENNFEEDASCIPELLLANLTEKDIVIGISTSGSAYYVQSALALAKYIGAYSVIIKEQKREKLFYCDEVIVLHSGPEVLAGSTRMKAGTATKKVLNFLSTAAMIKLGNVHGCYMTQMECINKKLILRAQNILKDLFNFDDNEAYSSLKEHDFILNHAINAGYEKLGK